MIYQMEEYSNQLGLCENNNNTVHTRGNFLYASAATSPSVYGRTSSGSVNVTDHQHQQLQLLMNNNTVKVKGSPSHRHMFQYPIITGNNKADNHHHQQQQQQQHVNNNNVEMNNEDPDVIKAKIIAHPHYSNLLEAYMDCQKVGAPPEIASRLEVVRQEFEERQRSSINCGNTSKDPELDQFMEAYCDMLVKYREELTRPIQEAMDFMQRIQSQLNMISTTPIQIFNSDEKCEGMGSSEEDQEMNNSGGETELAEIDPRAEDRELKNHLLRKYSGYLGSLKQELSKKKKKGKLPKDARQKLLSWWELHYKWPYPSESEKVALAESTGLDQKQINNWFINQRKRHWKPSEDLQFMVMDGLHPQNTALYMDRHYLSDGPYRLGP